MMTVGDFAILCACTPQTLRYYDRVNLLKPAEVDRWTGYRYYEEGQLLTFEKIRRLREAGFTIREVRGLLDVPAEELRAAVERKLTEQAEKLRLLAQLQKDGFPSEEMDMERKLEEAKRGMRELCERISPADLEEAGLAPELLPPLRARLQDYWEKFFAGVTALRAEDRQELTDTGWHREGWKTVGEALADLPELEDGGRYQLEFTLKKPERPVNEHYLSVMVGAVLLKNPGKEFRLGVEPIPIYTKENRIRLLRG